MKAQVLELIVSHLIDALETLQKAARASHSEATHESSKAENKYDTHGLEAAYLAGGQARQAKEVADAIALYKNIGMKEFGPKDPIDLTALVEVEMDGSRSFYFLGPKSGGLEVDYQGKEITVLTPHSPLGQNLVGKISGQSWTAKAGSKSVRYRIVSVS